MLISVDRTIHQALPPSLHKLRDDIRFERPDQGIDLRSRCEVILDGGPRRDGGPLLRRGLIHEFLDQLLKSLVDRKRGATRCPAM